MLRLLSAGRKTGVLDIRGGGASAAVEMTEGTLTAARLEDDVGEVALGAIFAVAEGEFVFRPGPTAGRNLSGSLDTLLDRAQRGAARFAEIRREIPDDRMRFTLSARATERPSISITADQWRVLLAVDGRRDVRAIAAQCAFGRLATLGHLHDLIAAGLVDAREPSPEEPTRAPLVEATPPVAPAEPAWTPTETRGAPPAVAEPPAALAQPPAPVAPPAPSPADLAAALAQRLSAVTATPPAVEAEPASASTAAAEAPVAPAQDFWASLAQARAAPVEEPPAAPAEAPAADERLAALLGAPAPPAEKPAPPPEPPAASAVAAARAPAAPPVEVSQYLPPEATAPILEAEVPVARPEKPKGLFEFLRRRSAPAAEAPAAAAVEAPVAPAVGPASPIARLAAFANALLTEYNSGQYGKGRLIERMQVRLRLVDEQAEPIDRPLPVADERLDVAAIAREEWPREQLLPYLGHLIRQIYDDARNVFGGEKAKRGYRAAIRNALGGDSLLRDRALAEILPKA